MSFFTQNRFARLGKWFSAWLVSWVLIPVWAVQAQSNNPAIHPCGTESLSPGVRKALEAEATLALRIKRASRLAGNNTITYIPIRPHIIRKSNGTGGYSMASLNNVMALANAYYLPNGIQFYFAGTSPDFIDNDALYNQFRQYTDEASLAGRDATNALNQYYVQSINTSLGGYAYYPVNTLNSTRSILVDQHNDVSAGNYLVPHELGHNFNLIHTFDTSYGVELVTRDPGAGANCTTAGDLLCDTPADPYEQFSSVYCETSCPPAYNCSNRDSQNNLYAPSVTNIMSYYVTCAHDFTAGQYDRMQAGLAIRQSHTAYTLDAPETGMAAPSNVAAGIQNDRVVISWQDNASNEMGYFIERSTFPTTGFIPIGGVAPNVTSFTDASALGNVRTYYRIKASNSINGSISPTTTIIAPVCRPTFTSNGCPPDITIKGVVINGTTLSQNSGCSSSTDFYTSFTAVSGTVTAGQSATFAVTKGTTLQMAGTIWVDLNNNGSFELSEQLFHMPQMNTASTFSGSLTIPASVTARTVAMRVVATNGVFPTSPCGTYQYGETEDYILTVIPACTTPAGTLAGTTTIAVGQAATLTATLVGSAPFSITVNGSNAAPLIFTGISASPFSFTVSPATATTYTLSQVGNDCGVGKGTGIAVVTVNQCSSMYTLHDGNWNNPAVWSCNRIPNQTDRIVIGHSITIPANFGARAFQIEYNTNGVLDIREGGHLFFGP